MPISNPRQFLICYDIADPKRLGRVHRYLSARAFPVQYSVFSARVTGHCVDTMLQDLSGVIHPRQDDVRVYTLSDQSRHANLGQQILPSGVALIEQSQGLLDSLTAQPVTSAARQDLSANSGLLDSLTAQPVTGQVA